jgi:ribonuclease Z
MTDFKVIALGTSAGVSSADRNMIGTLVIHGATKLLFDCGEGTSRQLMKARQGNITAIFLTHQHCDHTLGLADVIMNMDFLEKRKEPLTIYGTSGLTRYFSLLRKLGYYKPTFPVKIVTVKPGKVLKFPDLKIEVFATFHGCESVGYRLTEADRPGKVDMVKAAELGVYADMMPALMRDGKLVFDNDVCKATILKSQIVGPKRPGRVVVLTGDTTPSDGLLFPIRNADLWVSESTYSVAVGAAKAHAVGHSTAIEVGALAHLAGVRTLALTHISPRYTGAELQKEAADRFPGPVTVLNDLDVINVEYRD